MDKQNYLFIKKIKARLTSLPPSLYSFIFYKKLRPISFKFHRSIYTCLNNSKSPFIVQIGSADGVSGDPIHGYVRRFGQKGGAILIEPVNANFQALVKNYNGVKNLSFENVAIAENEINQKFYLIESKDKQGKKMNSRQGSLRLDINKKRANNGTLIETEVKCISFHTLIQKYAINHIDLLHIDTEGYDLRIIKSINFENIKPKMIFYEHKHLTDLEKLECQNLLNSKGYECFIEGNDTLAINYKI